MLVPNITGCTLMYGSSDWFFLDSTSVSNYYNHCVDQERIVYSISHSVTCLSEFNFSDTKYNTFSLERLMI
jgi:hypothetical protein